MGFHHGQADFQLVSLHLQHFQALEMSLFELVSYFSPCCGQERKPGVHGRDGAWGFPRRTCRS